MNMTNAQDVAALKSNLHATFDSPQGKEAMKFLEQIGGWTPSVFDSGDTNDIIARDSNRRLIGTVKTILELSVDQIIGLAKKEG